MKRLLILFSFLFFSISASSQTLEESIQMVVDSYGIMGMSLHINVNGTVAQVHLGLRDLDRNLPVTPETQYRIASVSKSVTALGMMKLVNDGLIELDDDISEALGYTVQNPNFPGIPITYRMLLSHTSGLQDGNGYNAFLNGTYSQDPIPSINEVLSPSGTFYTPNMWRLETPGTYFAYSNINYGLIGTLIEAVSGQRFDVYMKTEILEPLAMEGSYNIQDLTDINNLSVLYRFNNGWQAQWDNYQGVMPSPPDLSSYIPGTNGAYFGPQGGLRTSAKGMNNFANAVATNGINTSIEVDKATFQSMKAIAWDYNGSNGDNYFGLFNRWGLGLHHANLSTSDAICPLLDASFIGHPGEAYGLVSDNYFIEGSTISFSLLINGVQAGYQTGSSSFYTVEEDIFEAVCTHINATLGTELSTLPSFEIYPNPASNKLTVLGITQETSWSLLDFKGAELAIGKLTTQTANLLLPHLTSGVYFLKLTVKNQSLVKKLVID